jgi:hypothetical protein
MVILRLSPAERGLSLDLALIDPSPRTPPRTPVQRASANGMISHLRGIPTGPNAYQAHSHGLQPLQLPR